MQGQRVGGLHAVLEHGSRHPYGEVPPRPVQDHPRSTHHRRPERPELPGKELSVVLILMKF